MVSFGQRMKDPKFRGKVALGVLACLAVTLAWPILFDRDGRHLTAYDDGGQDISRARSELAALDTQGIEAIASTPHLLGGKDPTRTLLVIIGPERRYDASEARAIIEFLHAGGNVLLADETGFGSDIAREAGFAFSSQRVLDTQNYNGDPRLVTASVAIDGQAYRAVFNAPTSIVLLSNAAAHEVLATTSAPAYPHGSYTDTNGNGEIDLKDQPGPFPLVVSTNVGAGTLIIVADTGLFMNDQLGLAGFQNADLVRALARGLVTRESVIVIDESRHAPGLTIAVWENSLRTLGRLTSGPVAPLVFMSVLLGAAVLAWRFTRQTEDWTKHPFDIGHVNPVPDDVRPDLARAQRMARHRISERFNIPLEQVSAMKTEELLAVCGDRTLAEAAGGTLHGDPSPLFRSFSRSPTTPTESPP